MVLTEGLPYEGRNSALFLCVTWTTYATIFVATERITWAKVHDCRLALAYLRRWGQRIKLLHLPTCSPQANPIEHVWWLLHEAITRDHRCRSLAELLDVTFERLEHCQPFAVEDQTDRLHPAA